MPSNFISITPTNNCASRAVANFMLTHYPKNEVMGIVQAACKNCVDSASIIKSIYSSKGRNMPINPFLANQVETINMKILLSGYKSGDLIYLPDMAYPSGILMARITAYLKKPIIFVGDDNWGDWKDGLAGKIKSTYPYVGYRIDHWALEAETPFVFSFKSEYRQIFGEGKPDSISLISYKTLISIVKALSTYPSICKHTFTKKCVLNTYHKFYKTHKSWLRLNNYYIFKVNLDGEKIVGQMFCKL
jgi:hypothetical protein